MKVAQPLSTAQLFDALRGGKGQEFWLKIGDKEIPCRILSQREESAADFRGRTKAAKGATDGRVTKADESAEVMRQVLFDATNVKKVQYLGTEFLNGVSGAELDSIYDQYITLMREVNPKAESLSVERIGEMIASVKKKDKSSNDFFTWELAVIGRSYLEMISAQDSAPGP